MLMSSTSDSGPKGPTLVTRRAGIDDYSTIRHVQSSAIRSQTDKLLDDAEVTVAIRAVYTPAYSADLFLKTVRVAILNGDIVGTCAWGPSDDRGTAARISALFVAPLFQGNGIGRRLIEDVERDAAHNGFSRFTATVPVSIVPLFTALNFVTASFGTSRDVIPDVSLQVAFLKKP
jgi:GNAT superfamily N-acetyltransferase